MPAARIKSAASESRLLWSADPLLVLATQLRATASVPDLTRLREQIATMLVSFMDSARETGVNRARAAQATEVLAALIDQVAGSMPWGADAAWTSLGQSPAAGTDRRPARRMLAIASATQSDAGMQELISVALLLGFDKRNWGEDGGRIEQYLATASAGSAVPSGGGAGRPPIAGVRLPSHPTAKRRAASLSWLPVWASGLIVAAFLAVLFVALMVSLAIKSDTVYAHLAALNAPTPASALAQGARLRAGAPATTPRLMGILAGQPGIYVRDEIDRSIIVVPESKLFAPGDTTLVPGAVDTLRPIAAALQQTPGRIRIVGHTDRGGQRAARFASDWDLSVERARAVEDSLRTVAAEPHRLTIDGRASIEPLQPDDPARTVSGNGRIEIVLLAGR